MSEEESPVLSNGRKVDLSDHRSVAVFDQVGPEGDAFHLILRIGFVESRLSISKAAATALVTILNEKGITPVLGFEYEAS